MNQNSTYLSLPVLLAGKMDWVNPDILLLLLTPKLLLITTLWLLRRDFLVAVSGLFSGTVDRPNLTRLLLLLTAKLRGIKLLPERTLLLRRRDFLVWGRVEWLRGTAGLLHENIFNVLEVLKLNIYDIWFICFISAT